MPRHHTVIAIVFSVLLCLPSLSNASQEMDAQELRALLVAREGCELLKQGKKEEANHKFEEAFKLLPTNSPIRAAILVKMQQE